VIAAVSVLVAVTVSTLVSVSVKHEGEVVVAVLTAGVERPAHGFGITGFLEFIG